MAMKHLTVWIEFISTLQMMAGMETKREREREQEQEQEQEGREISETHTTNIFESGELLKKCKNMLRLL
jgi:hypothetical protein